jgi:hypothetical protein
MWKTLGGFWAQMPPFAYIYRQKLLTSIAPQLAWPYSGGPKWQEKIFE